MATLAEGLLSAYFTPGRSLQLALMRHGKFVGQRVAVSTWRLDGAQSSATVNFGPYIHRVDADAVALMDGDETVDTQKFGDSVGILSGMIFEYTYEVLL